jgi:putative endopeptidase
MRRVLSLLFPLLVGSSLLVAQMALPESSAAPDTKAKTTPGFDINSLDKTVDPCVNFYQFACGGWRAKNPIPSDQARWGRFNELAERNQAVLHDILEKESKPDHKRTAIEAQVGDYYAACMDESTIEKKGVQPIEPWLKEVDAIKDKKDFARVLGQFAANGVRGMYNFGASPDMKDSKKTIASVGQGGTTLGDRDDYLKNDPKSVEKRQKYEEHVKNMFVLLGDDDAKAAEEAKTVLKIETELAQAQMDRISMRDPKNRDNPTTKSDFEQTASNFDFPAYLAALNAPDFTQMNDSSPKFFKQVNDMLASASVDDLKTYLRWHVLETAAPALPAKFVKEDFDFNSAYLRGVKEQEPRWKRCVRSTDQALGEALGQLYVAKTFGPDGKARMRKMVDALTDALREDIKNLDWMTPESKTKALEKLAAFNTSKIGYPDKWRDYSSVKVTRDDYLGDRMRVAQFERKRNLNKIGKPTDRTEWGMSPPTVNAYNNSSNNEIVFPAGILQPPFFDKTMDDAVNFGAIGSVIGHEYTHGYDDQGSKYDAQGNFNNWWTDADRKQFEERTGCIADEYSGFVSVKDPQNGDVHLKGRLTLGENTADNGGVHVSYQALEKVLKEDPAKRKKIDGFTPEQRFFLGYAQVWCQNATDQSLRELANTDPHSPGEFRTNGVVSNNADFAKAYGCKAGQPMVRDNACHVW